MSLQPSILRELYEALPGFPRDVKRGVLLAQVAPKSPASKAGLYAGDVLVEFDGSPVIESGQVHNLLGDGVGRRIPLKVIRVLDGRASLLERTVVTEAAGGQDR